MRVPRGIVQGYLRNAVVALNANNDILHDKYIYYIYINIYSICKYYTLYIFISVYLGVRYCKIIYIQRQATSAVYNVDVMVAARVAKFHGNTVNSVML